MNMVIYRLNGALRKLLSPYIYAYMRGIVCSNTWETYTQSKVRIIAVILRRLRASNSKHSSQTRCLSPYMSPYIQQTLLVLYTNFILNSV